MPERGQDQYSVPYATLLTSRDDPNDFETRYIYVYMSMLFVRFVLWFAILVCTVAYYDVCRCVSCSVCMLRRFWWGISGM